MNERINKIYKGIIYLIGIFLIVYTQLIDLFFELGFKNLGTNFVFGFTLILITLILGTFYVIVYSITLIYQGVKND